MIPPEWLEQANERLAGKVVVTPLTYDPQLNIYLKWENRQRTGSFKIRGALNKFATLSDWERSREIVTASAGNHGLGVALAARQSGGRVFVFASKNASPLKLEKIKQYGAHVQLVEGGYTQAEAAAIQYVREHEGVWVSPYNDIQVICGQSTIAAEILEQITGDLPPSAIVPGGGGGLLAGMGARLKGVMRVVGVSSEASPFLHQLYHHGSQEGVIEYDSLADGLAGAVEPGSITVPLVKYLVDEMILVKEESIARAIAYAWYQYGETIEGSAATVLAAVLDGKVRHVPAVLVMSGGNIQADLHARICEEWKDHWQ